MFFFSLIITEFALAKYGLGPTKCNVHVGNKLRNVCSARSKEEAKKANTKGKTSKKNKEAEPADSTSSSEDNEDK